MGGLDYRLEMRNAFAPGVGAPDHPRAQSGWRNLEVTRCLCDGVGGLVPDVGGFHVESGHRFGWARGKVPRFARCLAESLSIIHEPSTMRHMPAALNEAAVEDAAQAWFQGLGYAVAHRPHVAPVELAA